MSDRNIRHNLELSRALQRIATPSVFDKIINEIDAREIPTEFIDRICVQYNNGSTVELAGNEITHPVPVNRKGSWEEMNESYKNIKEVKVFVNTDALETKVNKLVGAFLDGKC